MELSKMVLIAFLVIAVGLIVLMVANKRKATVVVATPTVVVARNFDLSGYGNSYKAQYY